MTHNSSGQVVGEYIDTPGMGTSIRRNVCNSPLSFSFSHFQHPFFRSLFSLDEPVVSCGALRSCDLVNSTPPDFLRRRQTAAVTLFFLIPWLCILISGLLLRKLEGLSRIFSHCCSPFLSFGF